ncbi:protein shuttle craft [Phlebotomus papatasi]|uniref:protein shuttle craft n=1 Tax=Phlebotomus papatasi TaxID=29031 RepID=UPI002483B45F|nr:protein shuttle craft [Phlebotomus papatasi]
MSDFNQNAPPGHPSEQVYVNFDQFIAQNNFRQFQQFPPGYYFGGNQYYQQGYSGQNSPSTMYNTVYQQPFVPSFPNYIAENSSLTATASEFVPRSVPREAVEEPVAREEPPRGPEQPVEEAASEADAMLSELNINGHRGHTGAIRKQWRGGENARRDYRRDPPPRHARNRPFQQHFERQEQQEAVPGRRWQAGRGRMPPGGEKRQKWSSRSRQDKENGHSENNIDDDDVRKRRNHPDFRPNRNLKSVQPTEEEPCSQREKLEREIDTGHLECLVCCEKIKPFQSVWSCGNCYHILHLNCIVKWAASSKSDTGWRCPACQNITRSVPKDYLCFCGKQKNPQYNRSDVAHSCGDVCGRAETCPHPCTLLCHPGPCPPCQASVEKSCGCGKEMRTLQCHQIVKIQCGAICQKILLCGQHKCSETCHVDACPECQETREHQCYCGKNKKMVICSKENNELTQYECGEICGQDLDCRNHKCQDLCHPGKCGECKLSPNVVKTCPCGKKVLGERKTCLDPVQLCGQICAKRLQCGTPGNPHFCAAKCHQGPCPPCPKSTATKCRCGHMEQMVKCRKLTTRADDARCKRRCTKKRNCGKHKCNQECCIDIDHVCPQPCTYTLSCGKHKCDKTCHPGHCDPCYRSSFQELSCECGATTIYPPVPCGTKRPACNKPCTRRHACGHEVLHNCHTAQQCPPCMLLTTKFCHGRHEQRKTIPCSQDGFSCGMPCRKELPCGRHKCIKICHEGPCLQQGEICKQHCPTPRIMCPHACRAPCHDGDCPETMCKESVEVSCLCGNRKQQRTCHDFASEYRRIATSQLATSMQEVQRGNSIELSDILGPIKVTSAKTKVLECNEECKTLERNRRLAIGLQIRNPDLPSKLQPKYSDFLRGWAKKDSAFVRNIHDKLTDLVKLAKESKQKSRSHSFPTMNREKRQVVHEMCEMFGVESVAYDAEPNRNVVATAFRETSWLPGMSILEVIERESGQRRVPLPNVWGTKRT